MARHKAEDTLLYLIFQRAPIWVSLVILAAIFVTLRYLLPSMIGSHTPFALLSSGLAPLLTFATALFAARAEWDKSQRRRLLDRQSSLDTLRNMSWQDFERLVGEAYRRQGYAVQELGGSGPDGGVDLVLRRMEETVLVQCKRWKQAKVGAPTVRELRGAVARDGATRGIFVTCGTFTREAKVEAQGQPLELVEGAVLLELVRQVQMGNAPIQNMPRPAEDAPPACPKCGSPMNRKLARQGPNAGNEFWGCSAYPRCRGTRQVQG